MVRPADPTWLRLVGFIFWAIVMTNVAVFVDGFNLFHALKRLRKNHLKWLDLWKLMQRQVSPQSEKLTAVYYFSAYADWLPAQRDRHEAYVRALESTGVTPVMGHFKAKDRRCHSCNASWIQHEEKETDVNIGLYLLNEAYKGSYDKALLVTRDSDLKPAVEMVLRQFPDKSITIVAPPNLGHSNDLISVSTDKKKIRERQVTQCLFPRDVVDKLGKLIASRPKNTTHRLSI